LKLELKRYGAAAKKQEDSKIIKQALGELSKLDNDIAELIIPFEDHLDDTADYDKIKKSITAFEKELKKKSTANAERMGRVKRLKDVFKQITKKYNALSKGITALQNRLDSLDKVVEEIDGVITEEEAKELILQKHHDLVNEQLSRYLNAEQRQLFSRLENIFDRYKVSLDHIIKSRNKKLDALNNFFSTLNYVEYGSMD
jgi:type I restriction enzyme M protein